MLKFRTEIPKRSFPLKIDHNKKLLSVGSCFADHIGSKLIHYKFSCLTNPFGTLYNPVSIARNLQAAMGSNTPTEADLFETEEGWYSFRYPGRFSGSAREMLMEQIKETNSAVGQWLKSTDVLLLTLGSSLVYEHEEYGDIVANCHKLPSTQFTRRRLEVSEVVDALQALIEELNHYRPDLQILLSVSPVRHGRDGLPENQRSKAVLILAADALEQQFSNVHYFPAYELLLDDLRDYRFYEADLVHPNSMAVDYIWEYFAETFFDPETHQINAEVRKVKNAAEHLPFRPESGEYQEFLRKQLEKLNRLEARHPELSFRKEREVFTGRLLIK